MNKVVACYFNSRPDPQRGYRWPADPAELKPLIDSVPHDELVILHDCFDDLPVENHRVECAQSPPIQRWHAFNTYLTAHPNIGFGWLVDSTDVVRLRDPWPHMRGGTLYCGWEPRPVGCDWIREHASTYSEWVDTNYQRMLLNPGVLGGDHNTLLWLTCRMKSTSMLDDPLGEMAAFNMFAYDHPHMVTGPFVAAVFDAWLRCDPNALWAHK